MSVRVQTRSLLGLLADLLHTADNDPDATLLASVLIHTSRGHLDGEPGMVDLLCGASTNRFVAGHTYTQCAGQLPGYPTVWAVRDAKSVTAVFKASAARDEFHAVDIHRDGVLVTVAEDPNLFDDGLSLSFAEQALDDYPAAGVYRMLDRATATAVQRPDGHVEDALPRTDFHPHVIAGLVKVAARRKAGIQMYRTHQREAVLMQVGDTYRAVAMPCSYEPEGDEARPGAEVYGPDLSGYERRRDAAAAKDAADAEGGVQDLDGLGQQPPPVGAEARSRSLADVLADAARHVIATRDATPKKLRAQLKVPEHRVEQLLAELAALGVVGEPDEAFDREVLATSDELPAVLDKIRGWTGNPSGDNTAGGAS